MTTWDNFFLTTASAAATLTGLIFIGVSINLAKILTIAHLPFRALGSMMLMATVLLISLFCQVPGQRPTLLGGEVLFTGIIIWAVMTWREIGMWRTMEKQYRFHYFRNLLLTQLATVPYLLYGTIFIWWRSDSAFYWLVPAFIFSFIKVITDAWVLLVEINR
jgi:modulator of FtsH protease